MANYRNALGAPQERHPLAGCLFASTPGEKYMDLWEIFPLLLSPLPRLRMPGHIDDVSSSTVMERRELQHRLDIWMLEVFKMRRIGAVGNVKG